MDPVEAGRRRRCDSENQNPPSEGVVRKKLDPKLRTPLDRKLRNPLDRYFFLDRCTSPTVADGRWPIVKSIVS